MLGVFRSHPVKDNFRYHQGNEEPEYFTCEVTWTSHSYPDSVTDLFEEIWCVFFSKVDWEKGYPEKEQFQAKKCKWNFSL